MPLPPLPSFLSIESLIYHSSTPITPENCSGPPNNTRELFRTAFTTNPTGLIDEVFLICNAAYGMQTSIEALRASQTDIEDLQIRLENTLITKSDRDATIPRLI